MSATNTSEISLKLSIKGPAPERRKPSTHICHNNWPTPVRFWLNSTKPPLEQFDLWLAQQDFLLSFVEDRTQRARSVTDLILRSQAVEGNKEIAFVYQTWLTNKVKNITETKEKYLMLFCQAHNKCAKAQDEPELTFEKYVQARGFVKQDDGSWQKTKSKPNKADEEKESVPKV